MADDDDYKKMVDYPTLDEERRLVDSQVQETPIDVFSFPWLIKNFIQVLNSPTLLNQQCVTVRTEKVTSTWDIRLGNGSFDLGWFTLNCRAVECNTPLRVRVELILPEILAPLGWRIKRSAINELTDNDKLIELHVSFTNWIKYVEAATFVVTLYIYTQQPERQLRSLEQLTKDMSSLYQSGSSSSDFTIKTGDDKGFLVHKAVLSARSPVFAAMFQSDYKEGKSGVVKVPDVASDVMELVLEHLYTGNIKPVHTLQPNDIFELAYAADKYALVHLLEHCDDALAYKISKDNAAELFIVADNLNLPKTIKVIGKYMEGDKMNDEHEEEDVHYGPIVSALEEEEWSKLKKLGGWDLAQYGKLYGGVL